MLNVLITVLAPLGGDVRSVAVDRAIGALLDTNKEILARLDRIEAKLDVLKNADAKAGLDHLQDAMKPHRTPARQMELVELARRKFVDAAAKAADDPMSRSIARVYEAVCWKCLGSPEDVEDSLGEAATDAYEAVYRAALQYNDPQGTAAAAGESWLRRHRPGWEETNRPTVKVVDKTAQSIGEIAPSVGRFLNSEATRPSRRLQVRMKPLLEAVNTWSSSVTEVYKRVQALNQPKRNKSDKTVECSALAIRHHREPSKPGRALLLTMLPPGATIDVSGIVISFVEAIPQTVDGTRYVDVHLTADFADYQERELARYSARPWFASTDFPSMLYGSISRIASQAELVQGFTYPFARPNGLFVRTRRMYEGTARHPELGSGYVGPEHETGVSGWKRFRTDRHPYALVLVPSGKFAASRDPRPAILVGAAFT